MPKHWALGVALAACIGGSFVAAAQTIPDEYAKIIQQHSRIGTLDGGMFGDRVGLSTGSLQFIQTDASLPGNDALAVQVSRRFEVGGFPAQGHFGDWDLDIPHLHGLFGGVTAAMVRWEVNAVASDHRCSEFSEPPEIAPPGGGHFTADEYWHGTFLHLPGSGDQELLVGGAVPTSGGPYHATTREGAAARCLASLATTSEDGSTGEGFEVVTPDGTVYTFDQMVSRYAEGLSKSEFAVLLQASRQSTADNLSNGSHAQAQTQTQTQTQGTGFVPNGAACCSMSRREFFLYPTRITDRFGNTVTYTWDSANPWRLLHIVASDGRRLDFTYSSSDPASILVQSVSDGAGHTWSYGYTGTLQNMRLASATRPDQSAWQFDLDDLYFDAKPFPQATACDTMYTPAASWSGSIVAPTGATAQYSLAPKVFGRSWGFRDCKIDANADETIADPYLFTSVAITGKTIAGPGLPSAGLAWTYAYGAPNNCWNPAGVPAGDPDAVVCTGSSPETRTTTVTEPDGSVSRYEFGNRVEWPSSPNDPGNPGNEGLLISEQHGAGGGALRTTAYAYGDGDAAPYASEQGGSLRRRGDYAITGKRRPQRLVETTQQDTTFTWEVAANCSGTPYCFDARARPTRILRSGVDTPTPTQTESIVYHDDTAGWVLGQVAQRTIDGLVAEQTTFDANHLPWKTYAFGKLRNTFTYDTGSTVASGQRGTLATVADGNGNVTTYTSWKRGIPQSVRFPATPEAPAGATRMAVVNDTGWITSTTDENGFVTGYTYDAMGRITQVAYPTGDTVAWAPTTSTFAPVASAEHGLAAGHWKQIVSTGNARKVTWFDALWRPVLVREYDTANAAGTDRYVATAYDEAGRVADVSYPLGSAASALSLGSNATWQLGSARPAGVRSSYDALGRPTSVRQDSELGVLSTTTSYLNGFLRRVTDARGNATTERFMAWDTPGFDWPVQIDAPEGQRTTIVRDTFGKPTAITRGEATP